MPDPIETLKQKYPQYAHIENHELARLIVKKYPQYKQPFSHWLVQGQQIDHAKQVAQQVVAKHISPNAGSTGTVQYPHTSIGPPPAPQQQGMMQRFQDALSTPAAMVKSAVQPIAAQFMPDKESPISPLTGDKTDRYEELRVAAMPYWDRVQYMKSQPMKNIANPHKQEVDKEFLNKQPYVARLMAAGGETAAGMASDPTTYALGAGWLSKAPKLAKATSAAFATMQAAPYIANPSMLKDPKALIDIPLAVVAAWHAAGLKMPAPIREALGRSHGKSMTENVKLSKGDAVSLAKQFADKEHRYNTEFKSKAGVGPKSDPGIQKPLPHAGGKEGAIQEQGPKKSMSRSKRPEVELQGVGEGNAKETPGTRKGKTEEVKPKRNAAGQAIRDSRMAAGQSTFDPEHFYKDDPVEVLSSSGGRSSVITEAGDVISVPTKDLVKATVQRGFVNQAELDESSSLRRETQSKIEADRKAYEAQESARKGKTEEVNEQRTNQRLDEKAVAKGDSTKLTGNSKKNTQTKPKETFGSIGGKPTHTLDIRGEKIPVKVTEKPGDGTFGFVDENGRYGFSGEDKFTEHVTPTQRPEPGSVPGERETNAAGRVPARSSTSRSKAGADKGATAPVQSNKVQNSDHWQKEVDRIEDEIAANHGGEGAVDKAIKYKGDKAFPSDAKNPLHKELADAYNARDEAGRREDSDTLAKIKLSPETKSGPIPEDKLRDIIKAVHEDVNYNIYDKSTSDASQILWSKMQSAGYEHGGVESRHIDEMEDWLRDPQGRKVVDQFKALAKDLGLTSSGPQGAAKGATAPVQSNKIQGAKSKAQIDNLPSLTDHDRESNIIRQRIKETYGTSYPEPHVNEQGGVSIVADGGPSSHWLMPDGKVSDGDFIDHYKSAHKIVTGSDRGVSIAQGETPYFHDLGKAGVIRLGVSRSGVRAILYGPPTEAQSKFIISTASKSERSGGSLRWEAYRNGEKVPFESGEGYKSFRGIDWKLNYGEKPSLTGETKATSNKPTHVNRTVFRQSIDKLKALGHDVEHLEGGYLLYNKAKTPADIKAASLALRDELQKTASKTPAKVPSKPARAAKPTAGTNVPTARKRNSGAVNLGPGGLGRNIPKEDIEPDYRGMSPTLRALHDHPIRKVNSGFRISSDAAVNNFLGRMEAYAKSKHPEIMHHIDDAWSYYGKGEYAKATDSAEKALTHMHSKESDAYVNTKGMSKELSDLHDHPGRGTFGTKATENYLNRLADYAKKTKSPASVDAEAALQAHYSGNSMEAMGASERALSVMHQGEIGAYWKDRPLPKNATDRERLDKASRGAYTYGHAPGSPAAKFEDAVNNLKTAIKKFPDLTLNRYSLLYMQKHPDSEYTEDDLYNIYTIAKSKGGVASLSRYALEELSGQVDSSQLHDSPENIARIEEMYQAEVNPSRKSVQFKSGGKKFTFYTYEKPGDKSTLVVSNLTSEGSGGSMSAITRQFSTYLNKGGYTNVEYHELFADGRIAARKRLFDAIKAKMNLNEESLKPRSMSGIVGGPGRRRGRPAPLRVPSAVQNLINRVKPYAPTEKTGGRYHMTAVIDPQTADLEHTLSNTDSYGDQLGSQAFRRVAAGLDATEREDFVRFMQSNNLAIDNPTHPSVLTNRRMENIWGKPGVPLTVSQAKIQAAALEHNSIQNELFSMVKKGKPSVKKKVGLTYSGPGGEDLFMNMIPKKDAAGNPVMINPKPGAASKRVASQMKVNPSKAALPRAGTAAEYETDLEKIYQQAYKNALPGAVKSDIYSGMVKKGLAQYYTGKPPSVINYKGVDYPVSTELVREGKKPGEVGTIKINIAMPAQIHADVKDATSAKPFAKHTYIDPNAHGGPKTKSSSLARDVQNALTDVQLASPKVITGHSLRVITMVTKMVDPSLPGIRKAVDTLFNAPTLGIVPRLTRLYDLANLDPTSTTEYISKEGHKYSNQSIRIDLARANAVDNRTFDNTSALGKVPGIRQMREMGHGALFFDPKGPSDLFKAKTVSDLAKSIREFGLDIRAKVMIEKVRRMADGYDPKDPKLDDKIRNNAYKLGEYVKKPNKYVEFLKTLNTYAGTSAPMRKTELQQFFGNTGISGKALSPAQREVYRAQTIAMSGIGTFMGYVMWNKLLSGHMPWDNKSDNTLELGNGWHLSMSAINPADTRAMSTLGLLRSARGLETGNYSDIPKAVGKGVIGAAADLVTGPGVRMIATAAGADLYLIDPNGNAMLAKAYPGAQYPLPGSLYDDDDSGKDTYAKRFRAVLGEVNPVGEIFMDLLGGSSNSLSALRSPRSTYDSSEVNPWDSLWRHVKSADTLFNSPLIQRDKEPKASGEVDPFMKKIQNQERLAQPKVPVYK